MEGPIFAAVLDPNWENLEAVLDANRNSPQFPDWLTKPHSLYDGTRRIEPLVSPLDAATVLGYPEHVRSLAREGAKPTPGFPEGRGSRAAGKARKGVWGRGLREGIVPSMHLAIRRGTPALVDALMDAGASPNDRDEAGRTPLHRLVLGNNIDAQKISLAVALIAKGAACELGLCAHHEALYFAAAAAMGDDAIAHTINALRTRDGRGRWTHRGAIAPIAIAVTHDNHAVVRDLIARGAHVDAGTDGETALKIAAERLDTEMVRTLADAGAHPNRARAVLVGTLDQRHLERSPRDAHASHDTATRKKMEAIAAMLIAAGADVNAARPSRWGHNTTALHIAATNGLDTIVKMLLEAGADPQRTCRQGGGVEKCALGMACDTPWTTVAVIRTLVEHGAKTAASRQIGPPDYTTVDYTDVGAFVAWASGPDAPRHRAEADKRTIIALLAAAYNCPHYETGILHRPMAMRNAFGEYAGPSFVKITDERGNTRKCERTPAAIARAEGDNDLAHWIENCNPFAELEHTGLLAPLLATAPIAFAPLNAARRGPSPLAAQAARPWAPPRHRLFCTAHRNMARATLTALVYRHNIPNVVAFLIIALVGRDAYIA